MLLFEYRDVSTWIGIPKEVPVLEVSSALVDRALADGAVSDDDSSCPAPLDSIMLDKALAVCTGAIKNAGVVDPTTESNVINWLQHLELVDIMETGEIVLAREAVKHGVSLSGDVLERSLRDQRTTLEVQEDLHSLGWAFVDDFRGAEISIKKACLDNPSSYFALLTHFADALKPYDEDGFFHHKQSEQYYKTIETAITHHPDEIVDVPTYKPNAFYLELQKFLAGDVEQDPRVELDLEKNRRRFVTNSHLHLMQKEYRLACQCQSFRGNVGLRLGR